MTECDGGSWSLRASRAQAEVTLWSLLSGPPQVERLQLRADSIEMFELKVDGELLVSAEHLTLGGKPSLASAMLTMREGAIRHGDLVLQLPRGASIELTTDKRTEVLKAKLRADEVIAVLNGERRATTGKLTADARVPSASVEAPVPLADITLHVAELRWLAQDMTSIAPLSCTFQLLAVNPRLRQVELGNGLVETTVQAASQPLGIELHVDKLLMTPSEAALRGRVALDGEDTLGLLDLADLPESLRLAFSGLEGAPFELRSQLSYELGSLDLHDIELRAGTASLKGHLALSSRKPARTAFAELSRHEPWGRAHSARQPDRFRAATNVAASPVSQIAGARILQRDGSHAFAGVSAHSRAPSRKLLHAK